MTEKNDLILRLNAMVDDRNLLKHPFYQEWTKGTLSLDALRSYAIQYYRHVEAFPRYISGIHSRCADFSTRQALLENLIEEERGADNHPELWLRFAEGLGVTRERVLDAKALPETHALVETFTQLTQRSPVSAGLAALYVYESQIPSVAAAKVEGLKRNYGIENERALAFFTVHREADVYHAKTGADLLRREATGKADQQKIAADGAKRALDALWDMLSAVHR
jgi:pyrroloquinoline-quinone synthase